MEQWRKQLNVIELSKAIAVGLFKTGHDMPDWVTTHRFELEVIKSGEGYEVVLTKKKRKKE